MQKNSAGLLMYRRRAEDIDVFLVHPGGPFWKNKDEGAWTLPKGEYTLDEDPLAAAKREFKEETGCPLPAGPDVLFVPLTPVKQAGGKLVRAWAFEGDCDPSTVKSNTFEQEWPPNSGKRQSFPEVDQAAWFDITEAKRRILKSQLSFLDELQHILTTKGPTPACDVESRKA
jgi:predicted NUDIX family NTP pyrophosphohydrolase